MTDDEVGRSFNRRAVATLAGGVIVAPWAATTAAAQTQPTLPALNAALRQIEEIARAAPEAPSILNKLNLNGDSVGSHAAALRSALGADLARNVQVPALGTGAQALSVEDYLRVLPLSVLGFIPVGEHAAIRSGTSDYDATAAFQAALDYLNQSGASGSLFVPRGHSCRAGQARADRRLEAFTWNTASKYRSDHVELVRRTDRHFGGKSYSSSPPISPTS